tara:strand:- start:629 stop:1213 length:585 start_codon:yes stop_codon:yes gene_type:complete
MIKLISIASMPIIITYVFWKVNSEKTIYSPNFEIVSKEKSIEIRQYSDINIMSTSKELPYKDATYSGFRTLARYIFGNNNRNEEIPMTAPVFTSMPEGEIINISFVIGEEYQIANMPKPITNDIIFKKLRLGKVAVIKFGMWATPKKINKMKLLLEKYLNKNSIDYESEFLVAQYNSPWVMPPFRKNELLVSIK